MNLGQYLQVASSLGAACVFVVMASMPKRVVARPHKAGGSNADRPCLARGVCREEPWLVRMSPWPLYVTLAAFSFCAFPLSGQTQRRPLDPPIAAQPETPHHRTRLILKDGSYQTVISYVVKGQVVRYQSAERNGQSEELPLALVDLEATQAWELAHDPSTTSAQKDQVPTVVSPELAREEAARAARTPEIAKDLHLPEEDSVLALDTFHGTPELVPLPQSGSDLNRETAHAILKKDVNPASSPHDLFLIKDERADIQLHVAVPVFYVRLEIGNDEAADSGSTLVVDTGGQAGRSVPAGSSARSRYVLEQIDVRQGARAISSLRISNLGTGKAQPGVIELRSEILPGGVWLKLTPVQPLEFGEYALLEILNDRALNSDVWDFGIHPTAKENDEALRPEPRRPTQLERRRRPPQE